MAKKQQEEEGASNTPQDLLESYLQENKDDHLNFVEEQYYKVSTGSALYDLYTNGGLPPGLHRYVGPPESGKTSAILEVCRNFLATRKNRRVLYVKAEGRLSREMQARTGLKFVWSAEEWVDGTIFVFETNIYETVVNLISKLSVASEENKTQYAFVIDSMDGLILRNDAVKTIDENNKVAGAPALTKKFLQKMANGMTKRGHLALLTSQYSTNLNLDTYAGASDKRPKQGGGGWAIAHYANFVFDFSESYNSDWIKEDDKAPISTTNAALGKWVKVKFLKSTNEKTNMSISYPVKLGVTGGSSVWRSYEICDLMKMYKMVLGKGWLNLPDKLAEEALAAKVELPEGAKWHGTPNFLKWLDENEPAQKFFTSRLEPFLANGV